MLWDFIFQKAMYGKKEIKKIIAPFNTFPYCEVEGDTIDLYYLKCYTLCKITH